MVQIIKLRSWIPRALFITLLFLAMQFPVAAAAKVFLHSEGDPGDGVLDPADFETVEGDDKDTRISGNDLIQPEGLPQAYRFPVMIFTGPGPFTTTVIWWPQWNQLPTNTGRGW